MLLWLLLLTLGWSVSPASAVAECMSGNPIKCFDCNSHLEPRCADPFNWTTLPKRTKCSGCCVKMIQGIGSPSLKVRRGCTDDLDINLFIVDHVCMTEGGGKGKMCFCEANDCNDAVINGPHVAAVAAAVLVASAR